MGIPSQHCWRCQTLYLKVHLNAEWERVAGIFLNPFHFYKKTAQTSDFSIWLVASNLWHTLMCLLLSSLGSAALKNTLLSKSSPQTHWLSTSQPLEPLHTGLRVSPGGRDYYQQQYAKSIWRLCFKQLRGPLFDWFLRRLAAPLTHSRNGPPLWSSSGRPPCDCVVCSFHTQSLKLQISYADNTAKTIKASFKKLWGEHV